MRLQTKLSTAILATVLLGAGAAPVAAQKAADTLRITIRSMSADFCAIAGAAPAPSSTAARSAAPSLFFIRISPSMIGVL